MVSYTVINNCLLQYVFSVVRNVKNLSQDNDLSTCARSFLCVTLSLSKLIREGKYLDTVLCILEILFLEECLLGLNDIQLTKELEELGDLAASDLDCFLFHIQYGPSNNYLDIKTYEVF